MLRIYLTDEARAKIVDGKIEGFPVKYEDGYAFVMSQGTMIHTSEKLKPHILKMTAIHFFPGEPHRTLGEYVRDETRAYVDRNTHEGLKIYIVGPNLEAIFQLYTDIRAGKITPTVSWEAEQRPAPSPEETAKTV